MPSQLKPIVAAKTDTGLYRDWNEDSVLAFVSPLNNSALLIVADGMGGMRDGKVLGKIASQLAVDTIYHELRDLLGQGETNTKTKVMSNQEFSEEYLIERFYLAFEKTNLILNDHQLPDKKRCFINGVTWAFVQNNQVLIANIGDCRAYHFRDGKLRLITNNWPLGPEGPPPPFVRFEYGAPFGAGFEIQVNQCDPSDKIVPKPGQLTFVHLYIWKQQSLRAGDRLLLCSDGLWGWMDADEIERQLFQAMSPEEAVQQLIDASNAEGGRDNIGVVVCDMTAS